ncbi:hypothetical protein [Desulfofalx alkaliphila]|uniref:hypothetical protein n=1 Tax=Desulfofalx alkaliphila TaxID=105483 RepID=UPI0012FEB5A6|nr:hypothetical protein [Desulfofalx alkaliphila]
MGTFVACSISGANLWKTGFQAMKLGVTVFIIPIAFVYNPALLMFGTVGEIVISFGIVVVGGVFLAAALQGYFFKDMGIAERLMVGFGGVLFILSSVTYAFVALGLGLIACGLALNWFKRSTVNKVVNVNK